MSRTRSAFLGTISSQIYVIISVLFNLFSVPIIIRHLNSEVYGMSIVIFQITAYLGMFDFGLTAGVERYLVGTKDNTDENKELIKRILSTCLIVYIFIAVIVIIAGNIFGLFAARIFNISSKYNIQGIISIISIVFGLQIILRAIAGIFFAHQRQLLSNTLSFILNISSILTVIIFVTLGYGLWSFVYSTIICFILNVTLNIFFFRKYYPFVEFKIKYYDNSLLKEMFSYGFSLFIIGIAAQIIFQTDRILIGYFVSLVAVSIYSITTKIPELMTQFLWKITDNAFPGIIEAVKSDSKSFAKIHDNLMRITISLSTVGFWFILVASYPFIKLWVGKNYYAGNFFLISVVYLYFIQHTFIHVTSMCLSAAGIVKRISIIYITEALINIVISIILVKRYNIMGVVYGTIISGLITSVWFTPAIAIKYMNSNVITYIISILKPILLSSFPGIILYFMFNNLFAGINNWFTLIFYSIIFLSASMLPIVYINRSLLKSFSNKYKKL